MKNFKEFINEVKSLYGPKAEAKEKSLEKAGYVRHKIKDGNEYEYAYAHPDHKDHHYYVNYRSSNHDGFQHVIRVNEPLPKGKKQ